MGLKSKKFTKQSYKKCLQESIDTGVPFVDQEFKAADSSLFSDRRFLSDAGVSRVVWKRPLQLVRDPHLLFREKVCQSQPVCISDFHAFLRSDRMWNWRSRSGSDRIRSF